MAIYHFNSDPKTTYPAPQDHKESAPAVPFRPFNIPDKSKQTRITFDDLNVNIQEEVSGVNLPGFYTIDKGMKDFFSNIVIPTKDSTKKVEARIAGGDKSVLRWVQDYLKDGGRPKLPVISINRASAAWHAEKFTPAYYPISRSFIDSEGSRVKYTYRPLPYMIEYQISIWAERKRDAEYILYDILSRFSPLAVAEVGDEWIKGPLTIANNGFTDSSDIDAQSTDVPKVRYDISLSAEGWLPVSGEKIVPTVLGRVQTLYEDNGTFLESIE